MVKIKEFYIVGLGALGGMYGSLAMKHKEKNHNIIPKFIVDSERKHKYVKNEIYVNGEQQHFQFVTPEEHALKRARDPPHKEEEEEGLIVVMICTKYMALTAALEQCRPFVCMPPSDDEDEDEDNENENENKKKKGEEEEEDAQQWKVRPNVVIFSVINGITKESIMAHYFPKSAVVAGVAQAVAGRTTNAAPAPNPDTTTNNEAPSPLHPKEHITINYDYVGKVHIGEADGNTHSPRLQAIADYLNNATITCEIQGNIRRIMWSKFMLNVGVNQAVTAAMGKYFDIQKKAEFKSEAPTKQEDRYKYERYNNPQARQWMMEAMQEALTLSHYVPCYDFDEAHEDKTVKRTPEEEAKRQEMKAMKINLTEDDVAYWDDVMQGVDGQQAPSMRQDIGAGRPTELALFAETIIALGEKFHVPTPVNKELHERISALERNLQ